MPNRILRDGILRSRKVFQLSPQAEVFYRRLMSVADDFGRYHADPTLLLSDCFPLRPSWADEQSMSLWIEECRRAKLVEIYEVDGTKFLEINNFRQRVRPNQESKFPPFAGNFRDAREISAFARATTTNTTTPPTTKEGGVGETKLPVGYAFDEQYAEFRQACTDFGMAVIDSDFTHGAWFEWLKLDFEQRRAAIAGIEERRENGTDPQMVPRPEKYLKNREWKRMVRKAESAIERSIRLA